MKDDIRTNEQQFKCEACGDICRLKQFETREGKFADVEFGDNVCKLVQHKLDWCRPEDAIATSAKPTFSINRYDKDGDAYETGIYLDFGNTTVRICDNDIEGFDAFLAHLQHMRQELSENIQSY